MFNKSIIWLLPTLLFFSCTDDLENRIKELEDRITELEYRLTTLNTTLESILTDIDEITAQLDELENEVSGDDGLIETIESLRAMLEDLKQRLTMITGIVNEDHYFDPSSGWMMFNDAIISGDSSHAEIYFSQEGDFAWELYSQFYLQEDESDNGYCAQESAEKHRWGEELSPVSFHRKSQSGDVRQGGNAPRFRVTEEGISKTHCNGT